MEYFEKNNFIQEGISTEKLLFLYVIVTFVSLILLIIVTLTLKSSVLWIVLFLITSIIYFGYIYYLIDSGDTKSLYFLVSAALLWFILYTVIQAVTMTIYLVSRS